MPRLTWDNVGQHFYETGISCGILWTASVDSTTGTVTWGKGEAWNGLISVTESPEGADEEAFYADNTKYLSLRGVEDFGGSITAYQSPALFDECDGTAQLVAGTAGAGVMIGQQPRKAFCLAYKTQIGNEIVGNEYAYMWHIIYNATASPSEREYQTINDSPEPNELSWDFTTTPVPVTGHKNTSIVKIDSRYVNSAKLTTIENSIMGTDGSGGSTGTDSTLLLPNDIITILNANG